MNFQATIEITPQQIADLMVTAIEGGINYWCKSVFLLSTEPALADNEKGKPWYSRVAVWAGEFRVEFSDAESDDKWELTRSKIEAAFLAEFADVSPADIALIAADPETGDVADAGDADRIIQKLLFGKVVFG